MAPFSKAFFLFFFVFPYRRTFFVGVRACQPPGLRRSDPILLFNQRLETHRRGAASSFPLTSREPAQP